MPTKKQFTFAISLSVLNHLGRQLYRSFATVLGEAISNAWDADARNVWIILDDDKNGFWIKDDGIGMAEADFQGKFLKIGYSKRKGGRKRSTNGRPFVGRKGIGKLALLSCATRISVVSKVDGGHYIGGTIDNKALDDAITDDLTPSEYTVGVPDLRQFAGLAKRHPHGTIIRFDGLKTGVKHSFESVRKLIALYFRFSLLDKSFKIYLNGEEITHEDLNQLAEATQFIWKVGNRRDPYVAGLDKLFAKTPKDHEAKRIRIGGATGFIASVRKPSDLKIRNTEERVGIDLFVNGRLRERDILKHIPTARIAESYLYGQIQANGLEDDKIDRFTTSREGIVADDPKFQDLLAALRTQVLKIVDDWDKWRLKHREEGDPENERLSKTQRASSSLFNNVAKGFESEGTSKGAEKVDKWVSDLADDATFNFESYAECFISENLVRDYIKDRKIPLTPEAVKVATGWKEKETKNKNEGNISIDIRRTDADLSYLAMDDLANLVDKQPDRIKQSSLARDASAFKPMRDAVAHTALLTDEAKEKLKSVRHNIKGRVNTLLGPRKR
jgi:hypothetical protein